MKHENFFKDFLDKEVNLNPRRLQTLEDRKSAVTRFLESKVPGYVKVSAQGSYAHQTIIKPVKDNDEFDADLLVFIKDSDFNPDLYVRDYVKELYDVFRSDERYKDKVRLKTRCVTIDYSGDFHLDIVPCIKYDKCAYVSNRKDSKYEKTDGEGYSDWVADCNKRIGGNYMRKSVRLLKFLRDHKDNFSVKSILLTTLVGEATLRVASDSCNNTPTALKNLSNNVNDFLSANPDMPEVKNPVLPEENFNRHWDDAKYKNFRDKFSLYCEKINDAYEEEDHDKSVKKWRKLFGDKFGELKDDQSATPGAVAVTAPVVTAPFIAPAKKPYGGKCD